MSARGNGGSGGSSLILGAGYIGAMLAECLLEQDDDVVLADNWYATDRSSWPSSRARAPASRPPTSATVRDSTS